MRKYDVIVVGGGHAGVEACLACAHRGFKTLLCTLNFSMVANMPCNPSIGGSAKGIVVREIDALGGNMGKAADKNYLQMKMLNTGKGPGVQCLRAQEDKIEYPKIVQDKLKSTLNLDIAEKMVTSITYHDGIIDGVIADEEKILCKAVILTTGTYLESFILRGHSKISGGPDGEKPAHGLSQCLINMGIDIYRLKTGTPPRIKKSSIDFTKTIIQPGSDGKFAFSYETEKFIQAKDQLPCYLIYTTKETHRIILSNLNESAQYNGLVKSVGPRYCPSIEGKVMTFKDKERHQLFLEPETRNGESIYLQGFSTSMDEEVQIQMVHSLPGMKNAEFLKYAYAIEYDAIKSYEYDSSLSIKKYKGLFCAGQICGTSGYEEAAALGLIAGINAGQYINSQPFFILKRNESYIGVMIDDLVTKGTDEPYRLLSSRAEYRLLLRHDNADIRLTKYGHELGLISDDRYEKFLCKNQNIEKVRCILSKTYLGVNSMINEVLISKGFDRLNGGVSCLELLRRPSICYKDIYPFIDDLHSIYLSDTAVIQLETFVKFEGYIKKEEKEAKSFLKFENISLSSKIDYLHIDGLALEARQKLNKIKPMTIGQASRISGVNPSDISILVLTLKKLGQL